MADKKINIDILVNKAEAAQSVGDLRKAMKELAFAQEEVDKSSPDFEKLTGAINTVEGRIGDLGDAMRTFTGSGVERLTSSTNLLSDSFRTLDMDKMKVGLQGLKALPKALAADITGLASKVSFANLNFKTMGTSMKSLGKSGVGELTKSIISLGKAILTNPILLLGAIIIGLIAVVIAFKDKIKPVKAIFDAIGQAIDVVIGALKAFSDAMGLTDFEGEESAKKSIDRYGKMTEAVEKKYDLEARLAEASGQDTYEIEKKKLYAVLWTVQKQMEALKDLRRANGVLTKEESDQLDELKNKVDSINGDIKVLAAKHTKDIKDENQKQTDDDQKKNDDKVKSAQAAADKVRDANRGLNKQIQDLDVELMKDGEEKDRAKLHLSTQRSIDEVYASVGSAKLKSKAIEEIIALHEQKVIDIKTKYRDDDKKKELEDAVIFTQLDAEMYDNNLKYKHDALKAQYQLDLFNAKDNNTQLIKIKEEFIMASAKLDSDAALKAQTDLLEGNVVKAQITEAQHQLDLEAQVNVLTAQKDLDILNAGESVDQKLLIEQNYQNAVSALRDAATEAEKKSNAEKRDNALAMTEQALGGIQSMSDTYFAYKLAGAKGNAAAELAIKKQQFKVEKAFNLVRAGIDGVRSVMSALATSNYPLAIVNGITAAANIAKIASAKFDGSGGSTPTPDVVKAPTESVTSQSSNTPTSTFNAPQFFGLGSTSASSGDTKVFVVESDITKVQQKVNGIQVQATQTLGG